MEVLLWFLWLCSAPVLSLETEKKMWYEPSPRTWDEALQFCRSEYGELATRETSSDFDDLLATDTSSFHAWLGLKKLNSGWRWWNGYEEHDIKDLFAEGEPQSGHECGKIIHLHTKAYTDDCEQRHFFFCETRDKTHQFSFVAETKPWAEALEHCQDLGLQFMDLTISSDFSWQASPVHPQRHFPVWIGLHHDDPPRIIVVFSLPGCVSGSAWRWSDGTPSLRWTGVDGSGSCVSVTSFHNTMKTYDCSQAFPFVCERLSLVLVKERLSWDHALEVCRNISALDSQGDFSLLTVEERDLQKVLNHTTGATTSKVWLGLRFLAGSWFWSDGAVVSLPSLPSCPETRLRCGALVLSTSFIEPADCSLELNVLCHRQR